MSGDKTEDAGKGIGLESISETGGKRESFGEALENEGFKPLKAERRFVGQGKPRKPLRRGRPKDPGGASSG